LKAQEHFRSLVEVLDYYGATVGEDNTFVKAAVSLVTDEEPVKSDANYTE